MYKNSIIADDFHGFLYVTYVVFDRIVLYLSRILQAFSQIMCI